MDNPGSAVAARTIELAWIEADEGRIGRIALPLADAPTYGQVLESEPVRLLLARLGWQRYSWSVFGKSRQSDERVDEADRIELLPALRVDAQTARLRRAAHKLKNSGKNSGKISGKISRTCRNP